MMHQQSSILVNISQYRPAQNTQKAFDGLYMHVMRLKASVSTRMNKHQLQQAFKQAQQLEQKAREIRKAIVQDIKDLEE